VWDRGLSRRIHPAGGALGAFCRPAIPPHLLLLLGPAAAYPCRRAGRHFGPWVADSSAAALLAPDGVVVPVWSEFAREAAAASQRLPPGYAKDKLKNFTLFNRSSVSYSEAHARSFGVRPLASSVGSFMTSAAISSALGKPCVPFLFQSAISFRV